MNRVSKTAKRLLGAPVRTGRALRQDSRGFTLIEVVVVVAIIGIVTATALPSVMSHLEHGRGRAAARSVAEAFNVARAQAIRTGENQIVFFTMGTNPPRGDTGGNALQTVNGTPVPILILSDGRPGDVAQNCVIDNAEEIITFNAEEGVGFGRNAATVTVPAPNDTALTIPATGSSFTWFDGSPNANAIMFRPDGIPVTIDAACNIGRLGSGGGSIYLWTTTRDYAITLSPLGGVSVHTWIPNGGGWTS